MTRKRYRIEAGKEYPGCYYYIITDGNGREIDRSYSITYYDENGKQRDAICGKKTRGYSLAKTNLFRADILRGKAKTRKQKRAEAEATKGKEIDKLWEYYKEFRNEKVKQQFMKRHGKSWRRQFEQEYRKGRSVNDESRYKRHVKPFWAGKDISQCTNNDTEEYAEWLLNQRDRNGKVYSDQTRKHAIGLFRRIVKYSEKKGKNGLSLQISDFAVPQVSNVKNDDMTPEERGQLLEVLETEKVNRAVADMMLLIYHTGMRRGEVLKLQREHLNFEKKTILLKDPKGGVDVKIPMSEAAEKILKRQKKAKNTMFVFPGKNGQRRLHIDTQARRLRDKGGLPKDFRPCHGLRHYFGTELAAKGVAIHVISALMGHKDIRTTQRYVDAREADMRAAVELMCAGGEE